MRNSNIIKALMLAALFTGATLTSGVALGAACPLSEDEIYTTLTDLIFAVLDFDDNGYVTVEEVARISQELADGEVGDYISKWPNGISRWWVHRALETFRVLSYVDTNDDGLIQHEEVSEYLPLAAFMYLDLNDNMVIDCEDWALITAPYTTAEGEEACGSLDLLFLVAKGVVIYVDTDADGVVGEGEITALAEEYAPSVLVLLDTDNDGLITVQELTDFLATLPLNVISLLDQNGDGIIRKLEVILFVPNELFDALDANSDNVLDCEDALYFQGEGEEPPIEGEPPVEGEEPPTEGEPPAEGEEPPIEGEPPVEGEEPPIEGEVPGEGEEPPIEGEVPAEGEEPPAEGEEPPLEGEPVEPPCALPVVTVENALDIIIPYVDTDDNGGLSMNEILYVYSSFPSSWLDMVDIDSDGLLTRDEILSIAGILIVGDDIVPAIDANGDRLIHYAEISDYVYRREFDYLDVNANGVVDCEDLAFLLPPAEGELPEEGEYPMEGEFPPFEGECEEFPIPLSPLSGRFGYYMEGPYTYKGEIVKHELTDPSWQFSGMFQFTTSGFSVAEPVISIAESYPEQVSITLYVNRPAPDAIVLPVVTQVYVTGSIPASNEAIFTVRMIACTSLFPGEGEEPPVEGEPPAEGEPTMEGEFPAEGEPPVEDEGEGESSGHLWDWPPYLGERCISRHLVVALRRMFVLLDTNEDGAVSYDEIKAYVMLPSQVFELLDTDGNGGVSWDEITAWRDSFPEPDPDTLVQIIRDVTSLNGNRFFSAGESFTVRVRLIKQGAQLLKQLSLTEVFPGEWTVVPSDKADAQVSMKQIENSQALHYEWANPVNFPIEITYEVTPSGNATGIHTILGQTGYLNDADEPRGEGIIPTVLAALLPEEYTHSADTDQDWRITLGELLRVIQLYNGQGYHWNESTVGGYAPGPGAQPEGWNHHADYDGDWLIELPELLRVIQLYNSESRYYYVSDRSEDGYMVAPF